MFADLVVAIDQRLLLGTPSMRCRDVLGRIELRFLPRDSPCGHRRPPRLAGEFLVMRHDAHQRGFSRTLTPTIPILAPGRRTARMSFRTCFPPGIGLRQTFHHIDKLRPGHDDPSSCARSGGCSEGGPRGQRFIHPAAKRTKACGDILELILARDSSETAWCVLAGEVHLIGALSEAPPNRQEGCEVAELEIGSGAWPSTQPVALDDCGARSAGEKRELRMPCCRAPGRYRKAHRIVSDSRFFATAMRKTRVQIVRRCGRVLA